MPVPRGRGERHRRAPSLGIESLTMLARPDADTVEMEMRLRQGGYCSPITRDPGQALGALPCRTCCGAPWSGPIEWLQMA